MNSARLKFKLAVKSSTAIGILGGLGPLASSAFVNSIYLLNDKVNSEQELPQIILDSSPKIPPRTPATLKKENVELKNIVEAKIENLVAQGCEVIVLCCVGLHLMIPFLRKDLKARVISLLDVILEQVITEERNYLILCSSGTRAASVFESQNLYNEVKHYLRFLCEKDQEEFNELLTRLKLGLDPMQVYNKIFKLIETYSVHGVIFGCTELHLLNHYYILRKQQITFPTIDALYELAISSSE